MTGSVVSRKSVSEPHCCHLLFSPRAFLLMGFPLFSSQSFSSDVFLPCSQFHPCSFVSSHFSSLFCLTPCLSFVSLSVSLFPLFVSVFLSSRQMAGLWVMVRCLGGVVAYRVEGYTAVRENPCLSLFSFSVFTLSQTCALSARRTHTVLSPWHSCCASAVYTYIYMCVCVCVCVCLLTEWGFVERDGPQSGAGNRLESEPPCPDSLISSLIHGLTAGSTRAHTHLHKDTHRASSKVQKETKGVHTDTLMLAQTPAHVTTEGRFND